MLCRTSRSQRRSQHLLVTVGAKLQSGTSVFSVSTAKVSRARRSNVAMTGSSFVTMFGINIGRLSRSSAIRIGNSPCENTAWFSETAVRCRASALAISSRAAVLTLSNLVGSVSKTLSYPTRLLSNIRVVNTAATGSSVLTLQGSSIGRSLTSLSVQLGKSMAQQTMWDSETSVRCTAFSSYSRSLKIFSTVGLKTSTLSRAVSSDYPSIRLHPLCQYLSAADNLTIGINASAVFGAQQSGSSCDISLSWILNMPNTASLSITLFGEGMGSSSLTSRIRVASTACERTDWVGDTITRCKNGGGLSRTSRILLSVGHLRNSVSQALTVNLHQVSVLGRRNVGSSGSAFVTLLGASFGLQGQTQKVRSGFSSCERSMWISETSIRCRLSLHQYRSLSSIVSANKKSSSITNSLSVDIARWTSFLTSNIGSTGSASFTLFGSGFGRFKSSPAVRSSNTVHENSIWIADSAVQCRSVLSRGRTNVYALTIGVQLGTLTDAVSSNKGEEGTKCIIWLEFCESFA